MVYLAGTELRVWSPVINSTALTKSAVMCHLLLTSTDEWSWGGSLAHMQIRDTYAWMITEIREYMHECKHMDTDRLFPYVHREDTHSPTHTHFTEVVPYLLYLLYPTKPTRVLLQLECSQNYSISHILNGPTSTLMVTHTHTLTHTWTCLGALLDTHREHCRALHNLLRLGKTKDRKRKKKIYEHDFKTAYILS